MNATVNGIVFENITMEQAQALMAMAAQATEKPSKKPISAKKRTAQAAAKYDAKLLDSKRVERMASTAVKAMESAGYPVKPSKRGAWVWLYSQDGKGREEGFKAAKLAKGWTYSPKRGAWYRDFSNKTA